jgi:hypothetical protein
VELEVLRPKVNIGIAGWPLRRLSLADLAYAIETIPCELIEIPKDLLDAVSLKKIHEVLRTSDKIVALAGTTDFATLSGLSWKDYRAYLDVQVAAARFLGCRYWRVFLQASTPAHLERSIKNLVDYSRHQPEVEIIVETHGGAESTLEGFRYCLENSDLKFVVDFSNIPDSALREFILEKMIGTRIAYFHVRNIVSYREESRLVSVEIRAEKVYPHHVFLWEPKDIDGRAAIDRFLDDPRWSSPAAT